MQMEIPSGMLCKAIAKANFKPNSWLDVVEIKVVIPSGILWSIKTIVVIIPSLYKLFSFNIFSVLLSTMVEISIPSMMKIEHIIKAGNGLYMVLNRFDASGISDIREMVIITPLEKARDFEIIESCLWFFKKQGIIPIIVENPAIVVIIKLVIVFMVNYMF